MNDLWTVRTPWHRLATTARVAAFLLLTAVVIGSVADSMAPFSRVGGWTAAALLIVGAATCRRWFVFGMVCAGASGLLQLVWFPSFTPFADIMFAYVFNAAGAHPDRRWRRRGLVAAVAATVLPTAITNPLLWPPADRPTRVLVIQSALFLLACGSVALGGWVSGYLRLQRRTAVEANLATQVAQVEAGRLQSEFEAATHRERIATEMHDVVAHSLAVIAAQADGARYALRNKPELAEQALDVIGDTSRAAITDLRRILGELRHQQAEGGAATSEQLEATLDRLRRSGMHISVHSTGTHPDNGVFALTMHRVLAEALTNALKYADLRQPVEVELRWTATHEAPPGLRVTSARRDGPTDTGYSTGHGIIGMRQRAAAVGGTLTIDADDHGWTVRLDLPHDAAATYALTLRELT